MAEKIDIKDFPSVSGVDDNDNVLLARSIGDAGKMRISLFRSNISSSIKPSIKDGVWWIGTVNQNVEAKGKSPEFRTGADGIEWRYVGEPAWIPLVSYNDISLTFEDLTPAQKEELKLHFADLTASDKAELMKPAIDAAKRADEKMVQISQDVNQAITATNTATTNANTATTNANTATVNASTAINNANASATDARGTISRMEALSDAVVKDNKVIPKVMSLVYPQRITYRNWILQRIIAALSPEDLGRNVLFLGDDKSIDVYPDGTFTVKEVGISRVHVIPTENTAIYKTIHIQVTEPDMRLVKAGQIRLAGNGNIRLT